MKELTPEMISAAMAKTRERGGTERRIRAFNASDELYLVLTDDAKYADSNKAGLKSQFSKNIKELGEDFSHLTVIKTEDGDIALINTTRLAEQAA